jgi:cytochrome c
MKFWVGVLELLACIALPLPVLGQSRDGELRAHGGPVRAIAAMPDGRLASAGFDGAIIVWDLGRGQALRVLRQHESAVNALLARADGCLVSGGEDGQIAVWCETAGPAPIALAGHGAAISSLAMSPNARLLVSGSWDRTVRAWDLHDKGLHGTSRVLVEHAAPVTSVAFSTDGATILSASQDGVLRSTGVQDGQAPRMITLHASINGLVATHGGGIVVVCADGTVREFDSQLAPVRELAKVDGPLTAITLSPDGTTIAAVGLRTPGTLIDRRTGAVRPMSAATGLAVWAVAFAHDGREFFTGGGDRTVRRFDAATASARTPSIPSAPEPELASTKDLGARVFRACAACHGITAQDTNLAGPTLHQIMGRRIASLGGYAFSPALAGMNIVWTAETISKLFEVGPTAFTPGTKMPEQRITDPDERQALVDWLSRVTVP